MLNRNFFSFLKKIETGTPFKDKNLPCQFLTFSINKICLFLQKKINTINNINVPNLVLHISSHLSKKIKIPAGFFSPLSLEGLQLSTLPFLHNSF